MNNGLIAGNQNRKRPSWPHSTYVGLAPLVQERIHNFGIRGLGLTFSQLLVKQELATLCQFSSKSWFANFTPKWEGASLYLGHWFSPSQRRSGPHVDAIRPCLLQVFLLVMSVSRPVWSKLLMLSQLGRPGFLPYSSNFQRLAWWGILRAGKLLNLPARALARRQKYIRDLDVGWASPSLTFTKGGGWKTPKFVLNF